MWIMHGDVMDDDGDVGGDVQVGPACSVRFVNPELPGRVITVYAYASAPERSTTTTADGVESAEYGHDLDSLGVDSMTEFMICRDIDDPGSTEEWSDYKWTSLDTRPFGGDVDAATTAARAWIRAFDANRDITWDGERF